MPLSLNVNGKTWTMRVRQVSAVGLGKRTERAVRRRIADKITVEQYNEEMARIKDSRNKMLEVYKILGGRCTSQTGGSTEVEIAIEGAYGVLVGAAVCGDRDGYDANKGLNIATRRALATLPREERTAFWEAYNRARRPRFVREETPEPEVTPVVYPSSAEGA